MYANPTMPVARHLSNCGHNVWSSTFLSYCRGEYCIHLLLKSSHRGWEGWGFAAGLLGTAAAFRDVAWKAHSSCGLRLTPSEGSAFCAENPNVCGHPDPKTRISWTPRHLDTQFRQPCVDLVRAYRGACGTCSSVASDIFL